MRRVLTVVAILAIGVPGQAFAFTEMQRQVVKLFKRAIFKVEVTGARPQLDASGSDGCKSQGMGFLVSRSYIVSAKHVIDVPDACQKRVAVSSAAASFQSMVDVVHSYGDIVLLKLRGAEAPPLTCSLAFSDRNVYDQTVVRFAMPAALVDPEPLQTEVGDLGQFAPNVRFTPAPVHAGDSGGPIIHMFAVIGITKEKLTQVDGYGVMVPVEPIIKLLQEANFQPDDSTCNPLLMYASPLGPTFSSEILSPAEMGAGLETAIRGVSTAFHDVDPIQNVVPGMRGFDLDVAWYRDRFIDIPGAGRIEVPPLSRPSSTTETDIASVVQNADGSSVTVALGPAYPMEAVAPEFLLESLKSQMWDAFMQSFSSTETP